MDQFGSIAIIIIGLSIAFGLNCAIAEKFESDGHGYVVFFLGGCLCLFLLGKFHESD